MADVGRITELWRQAAAAADVPPATEDLSLVTAMKFWRESETECARLRSALQAIANRHPDATRGEHPAVDIARAALGVEGEQE